MSSVPLRLSEDGHSSIWSSIADVPAVEFSEPSPRLDESTLRKSTSFHDSIDDLEFEDPLSRVHISEEFERFSGTEIAFITSSFTGVLVVPLLYLLVSKLNVLQTPTVADYSPERPRSWMNKGD